MKKKRLYQVFNFFHLFRRHSLPLYLQSLYLYYGLRQLKMLPMLPKKLPMSSSQSEMSLSSSLI